MQIVVMSVNHALSNAALVVVSLLVPRVAPTPSHIFTTTFAYKAALMAHTLRTMFAILAAATAKHVPVQATPALHVIQVAVPLI